METKYCGRLCDQAFVINTSTFDPTVRNCSVNITGHKTYVLKQQQFKTPSHYLPLESCACHFTSNATLELSTFHVFTPYFVQRNYRSNLILTTTCGYKYIFLKHISGYET